MIKNWRGGRLLGACWLSACALAPPQAGEAARAQDQFQGTVFQGTVEFEEVDLGFEFAGRLLALWVRRGDRVEAGARIATIDDGLEQAATQARRSEAQAAQARLADTRAGSRPEEMRALEARIRAADAVVRQLGDDLRRETGLMEKGSTPRAVVDGLAAQLERASAEQDELEQHLRLLRNGPRREEVAVVASQAAASEALLALQERREQRFELRAPLTGEVLDHHREPGEVVAAGAPVVTLADTSRPFAEVFVPQAELGRVVRGGSARVRVDAFPEAFPARVEAVARRVEFTPRFLYSERERPNLVVRVRVRIDDPGRRLHAGLPAHVEFDPVEALAPAPAGQAPGASAGQAGG